MDHKLIKRKQLTNIFWVFGLLLFTVGCVSAFNYRWYNLRVDKLTDRELSKIELRSPNIKKYRSLKGIQLHHRRNQHSPFCTIKCGDLKAAAIQIADLEADLAHCRGGE